MAEPPVGQRILTRRGREFAVCAAAGKLAYFAPSREASICQREKQRAPSSFVRVG